MPRSHPNLPLHEYQPRRIALLKPSALGDIVHSLPVLSALRQRFPTAHISWIISSSYAPLLQGHPDLDAVLSFDRGAWRTAWGQAVRHYGSFIQHLRQARFDLVIDLQGLLRTGIMALCSGAPRRVGLATAREGSAWSCTDIIDHPRLRQLHAVERYWQIIKALGGGGLPVQFRVPLQPAALAWARQLLSALPRPWLCLGVGARWETKRWLPEHFAALADTAQHHFGGTVIFLGRSEEQPLAQKVARQLAGPVLDVAGRTDLPQLAALLSLADVMIANDSGPLHLAAALGRPVLAPYTCTSVQRHGPYGQEQRTAEAAVRCQGSYLRRCGRLDCMAALTPELLWPRLHEVLDLWQSNQRSLSFSPAAHAVDAF